MPQDHLAPVFRLSSVQTGAVSDLRVVRTGPSKPFKTQGKPQGSLRTSLWTTRSPRENSVRPRLTS